METMTLMPMAVAATSARPRAVASFVGLAAAPAAAAYVRMPEIHGAMPSSVLANSRDLGCSWLPQANGIETRKATTKAHKAFGTRRLGETST